MIKRDEIRGPSCLTHAADDEPIFVLRANDELAPIVVGVWATMYRWFKGGQHLMTPDQWRKYLEAQALATSMAQYRKWRSKHASP